MQYIKQELCVHEFDTIFNEYVQNTLYSCAAFPHCIYKVGFFACVFA